MNQAPSQNTPASPSDAKGALVALFEAFPADRGEGSMAVGTYLIAVEGYSLRAIEGAVKRLIRGEVSGVDRRFLPTPAQLSQAVAYCEELYAPRVRPAALPAPEDDEFTEAELARRKVVADAVRARCGIERHTAGERTADRETMPASLRAERDRDVERAAEKLRGTFHLSPEALAIMKARDAA